MRGGLLFIVLMAAWLLMSGHYNGLLISLGVISVAFCVWLSYAIDATDEEGLPTHIFARLVPLPNLNLYAYHFHRWYNLQLQL